MLWPYLLPVKTTFLAITCLVFLATLVALLLKRRAYPVFLVSLVAGMVLFVPSCAVVKHFVDAQRFGIFQYTTGSEITDDHIGAWIPKAAKNVTVDQQSTGFRAKYEIPPDELKAFLDQQWERYGEYATTMREDVVSSIEIDEESMDIFFGEELNWPALGEAYQYDSPTASNGAGFVIWYSPTKQIAYQRAGYW